MADLEQEKVSSGWDKAVPIAGEVTAVLTAVDPKASPTDDETANQVQAVTDTAAVIATQVAPQYAGYVKLADSLVPFAVHSGLAIAHLFQHLFSSKAKPAAAPAGK